MSVITLLSSQVGDRTEESNRRVVTRCLSDPALLDEIAVGLRSEDDPLTGDCAEVMTMVAEMHPEWVAPYAPLLPGLLSRQKARVRWEAMHALALVTTHVPDIVRPLLPELNAVIHNDRSVIVRDCAIVLIGNYAGTGSRAAEETYPILKEALRLWDGRHAGRALDGLGSVADRLPQLGPEIRTCAEPYLQHKKSVVGKSAKRLIDHLSG